VNVGYNARGWAHLILGLIAIAVGFGLMAGNMVVRVAGIAIVMISTILTSPSSPRTRCGRPSPSTSSSSTPSWCTAES
jgi:hypothetical protein